MMKGTIMAMLINILRAERGDLGLLIGRGGRWIVGKIRKPKTYSTEETWDRTPGDNGA